jgi:TATA-box binding protein (TBP) (component of TFIID and TFIIIB)
MNMDLDFKVVNIVATARFRGTIDIELIKMSPPNGFTLEGFNEKKKLVELSIKKKIHGVQPLKKKKSTHTPKEKEIRIRVKVFERVINVFGATSIEEIRDIVARILSHAGIDVSTASIKVVNVVVITEIGRKIDIYELSKKLPSQLAPDIFPGLIARVPNSNNMNNISFLIFSTGKIVILGASSIEKAIEAFEKIRDKVIEATLQ